MHLFVYLASLSAAMMARNCLSLFLMDWKASWLRCRILCCSQNVVRRGFVC